MRSAACRATGARPAGGAGQGRRRLPARFRRRSSLARLGHVDELLCDGGAPLEARERALAVELDGSKVRAQPGDVGAAAGDLAEPATVLGAKSRSLQAKAAYRSTRP
jgi:hypothetical protein